ncbi:FKBP-type peptidyl-prolyl cis-trans isomerase [Agaribacterium haliotis]|uniref:FKBP-type peptidyl-prolyl cis-trans isomerase n=1 Tax=Agaribacterium haliotis TaxID=2013869 RepID=UPI000BB55507|nr:FKBP-type peptidyl-prolyl cis-trans isomerase [Agaribacterium haliotis]
MQVEQDLVVSFYYSLHDSDGNELENNFGSTPMSYLHGHGNLFKKLENELTGLEVGAQRLVELSPSEAYGERRENATKKVPVKHLLGKPKKLKAGQFVKVNSEKGAIDASVIKPGKFMVELDFNHPLAGKNLSFNVEIAEIRQAEADELAHGHAHGPGGHQHH